jgi:hypothetical protein
MREQLLGYLLGALDASQQSEVERAVQSDPQLREELDLLDQALEPLRADRGRYEPPCGLAERTLDAVAAIAGWPDEELETAPRNAEEPVLPRAMLTSKLSAPRETAAKAWSGRWGALDVAASAAILAAAAMLFFPAVNSSRFDARVAACQSNLLAIARGLENYGENHQQQLVTIPESGNLSIAGVYAPTLHEAGYVTQSKSFYCPGAQTARDAVAAAEAPRIPRISEMERAIGEELRQLQRRAGGSFGYTLGYLVNGEYGPLRNLRRATFPIMTDAPGPQHLGRLSTNHEGLGQNALFEDFHIEFLPGGHLAGEDDIFHSDRGVVEAGLHQGDAVIGASHSSPLIWVRFRGR